MVCRKVESREMRRKERAEKGKKSERQRTKKRGEVKRSWSGYETNSDLIWCVYDCVFLFFSRL